MIYQTKKAVQLLKLCKKIMTTSNNTQFFTMNFHGNVLKVKVVINKHFKTGEPCSYSLSYYFNDKYTGLWDCFDLKKVDAKLADEKSDLEAYCIQKGIDKLWAKKTFYGTPKYIMNH